MSSGPERILVFVRHADPVIDPETPPAEWRLSAAGRARARALAARLRGFAPARCYTSPEPKARETAGLLLDPSDPEPVVLPGLAEQDRAGVVFYDDPHGFDDAVAKVFRKPSETMLGRESADAARERFASAVRAACREGPGNLLFVTHGTVLALFLGDVLGRDGLELWRAMDFGALAAIAWPAPRLVEWRPAG